MVEVKNGEFESTGSDGVARYFSVAPMPETGWIAFVGVPVSEVYAAARQRAITATAIALAAISLLIALALAITRRITGPMAELERATRSVLKGNLAAKVTTDGPSEVTSVATAFNAMTDKIEASTRLLETDITERKQAEDALRESEARFHDLVENAADCILIHDIDQNCFVEVNKRIEDLMGYSRDEVLKASPARFFAQKQSDGRTVSESIAETISRVLAGEAVIHERELVRADGKVITCSLFLNRLPDPERRMIRVSITDITKRKQAEAELLAARQSAETASLTKSRFLAAASHDLRQPMQAISLFTEALVRTGLNAEQKRISDYLAESTQSLGNLLNTLLDISKLDAGAIKVVPELIATGALVRRIDAEFSPVAAAKALRFKVCFPLGETALVTDGKLLMSLLGNLIGNAIKYTAQGGILVAIRRRGNQALIQVWDTGIGIAPEHMDAIYDEYFQIGNPERDRTKGLGLGLALARRIAGLLETDVVCRSRQGRGSVFEFRLLLSEPAAKEAPGRIDPIITAAKPSVRHAVLVEDDLMVAMATKAALEFCGMTVTRYKTAEEALADSAIADADAYIVDLWLPGLNGFEFLDAVQRRATKPIKAVVVTGDTSLNLHELMQSTSWQVLLKPVTLPSLLSAIESQDSAH